MKLSFLLTFLTINSLFSQVSQGGSPRSFNLNLSDEPNVIELPIVNHTELLNRDAQSNRKDEPYVFGESQSVEIDIMKDGICYNIDEGTICTLGIKSKNAYSLNLIYDTFHIPPGSEFFIYDEHRSTILGAFTNFNHKTHGGFSTAPTAGDIVFLEYFQPHNALFNGTINISNVIHGYRNVFFNERGYGDSGSCNNNVNCSEFLDWESEIRSVAMILSSGGSRLCTGSLVNNVRQDLTPYFLTADHCLGGESNWIFMFNYESPVCNNQNGPTNMTLSGSTLLDNASTSDYALLLISEEPPLSYGVHFAGWSAVNTPPQQPVAIHHPSGDIKKISFDYDIASSDGWSNNDGSHWRILTWEDGTTEPGSSGSPLFDNNHRIVGQLHGGTASCSNNIDDYYGKVSTSWGLGLSDYLDPDNTGITILDGIDQIDLPDPELYVDVLDVSIYATNEEPTEFSFLISNIGEDESELNYDITVSPFQTIGGGPDNENYFLTTSSIDQNLNYNWIDISEIGTEYIFTDNDNSGSFIDIGFDFIFYQNIYTELFINPNGWIGFENDNNSWENTNIPTNNIGPAIFALWDDLNPINENCNQYCAGQVFTHSNEERIVIWFNNVAHWWTHFENTSYNFQIVLYQNGQIDINYNSLIGSYAASIGIQKNSTTGLVYAYNNEILEDNFSLIFNSSPEWLNLEIDNGTILEGSSTLINFIIDAPALLDGIYTAYINIQSNGGTESVPINLFIETLTSLTGDLNDDEAINVLDVVILVNMILEEISTDSSADLNNDENVNVLDVVILVNIILESDI